MGRGQQMSIHYEKPGTMPDLRNGARQRRLVCVALFAALLPFAITRTYTYYMSPEALSFFEGQPTPSSPAEPLKESTSSIPDTNTLPDVSFNGSSNIPVQSNVTDADADAKFDSNKNKTQSPDSSREAHKVVEGSSTLSSSMTKKPENATSSEDSEANRGEPSSDILRSANSSDNVLKEESDENKEGAPEVQSEGSKDINNESIVMEAPMTLTAGNTTNSRMQGRCDLVQGKWVPDSRPPDYTNNTCRFIQGHQNCLRNGRPDLGFMYWKWKPDHCDLPRIDAVAFLTAMRNRSMSFAGDSIARNQFQSLLCLLSQVEEPKNIYHAPDDRDNVHRFPSYNFTLAIYWSPYLVHVDDKMLTWNNKSEKVAHIHVDKLDEAWFQRVSGVDVVQISTGQWWFKRGLFLENGKVLGGHICDGWEGCEKEIGFAMAYTKAIRNILKGSLMAPGYGGVTVLRTFGPEHFEAGQWNSGGECSRTSPGGVPMNSLTKTMWGIQKDLFQNITEEVGGLAGKRLKLLDITDLAQIRADGHPNVYREYQPPGQVWKRPSQKDCLHWCLPGPIDTWNDLLVESLREIIYR